MAGSTVSFSTRTRTVTTFPNLVLGTHFPPPTGGRLVGTATEPGVRFASGRLD